MFREYQVKYLNVCSTITWRGQKRFTEAHQITDPSCMWLRVCTNVCVHPAGMRRGREGTELWCWQTPTSAVHTSKRHTLPLFVDFLLRMPTNYQQMKPSWDSGGRISANQDLTASYTLFAFALRITHTHSEPDESSSKNRVRPAGLPSLNKWLFCLKLTLRNSVAKNTVTLLGCICLKAVWGWSLFFVGTLRRTGRLLGTMRANAGYFH